MSALKQLRTSEVSSAPKGTRKPAARADSLHWKRYSTDYAADTGYSPVYHEAVRHKPRLCGESAVMRDLIEYCNMHSYGRSRGKKDPRHVWTDLLTTEELAEHCLCRVREIQRQISEMEARGMIAVRKVKGGLEISLLYAAWPGLEDYAVWKRKQKVTAIDEGEGFTEDEPEPEAPGKDAVPLFKRPTAVRPGRASRAAKVAAGVKEFVFVNESATVGVLLSRGVIEAGRLTVYGVVSIEDLAKEKRNTARNDAFRESSTTKQTKSASKNVSGESLIKTLPPLPRGDEVEKLFDPLLNASRAPLISTDRRALELACAEMGSIPFDVLVHAVMAGPRPRGARPINSPLWVAKIIKDARLNWEKSGSLPVPVVQKGGGSRLERGKAIMRDRVKRTGEI